MFTPLSARQWNYETAAHLLNRAGFGGTPAEIEAARGKGLDAAVRDLVDVSDDLADVPPPEWAHPRTIGKIRTQMRSQRISRRERREKKRAFHDMEGENILDLRRWWLERMLTSPAPLLEKMTLFWHGHFATSVQKVGDGYWMWLQNDTLRRNALGNFATLTKKMSRDPAMMIYLDLQKSEQQHPNENWARELMELFTVGIGNYSEQDIREAARAFTGYHVNLSTQQFRFALFQHDAGSKTFMGRTGSLDGDDIIGTLLEKPACAQFIGRKIWRYFVEDDPSPETVNAAASRLRAHDYEIRPLLREIFSSSEFYSERVIRSQIKSPLQFLIQTAKLLEIPLPPVAIAQNAMRQMGQVLFAPPSVKGWDGGRAWINTSTLLFRYNFANYLINGDAMLPTAVSVKERASDFGFRRGLALDTDIRRDPIDVSKLIPAELRRKPQELVAHLSNRLFQAKPAAKETEAFVQYLEARKPDSGDETMRGLLHLMMSTPQFQLT
jgi:uncharacterized protein (DUF1800 family)